MILDNGPWFDNKKVRSLCEKLGIKKHFLTTHDPQVNAQVETVNETINCTLKKKLDPKSAWVDELPQELWAIRTTSRMVAGNSFLHSLRG